MKSDFAAAKVLLELTREELCGDDPTSEKMRDVIDLVIQALTRAQKRGREAQVIPFPTHTAAS
ncbi:hypothetical protein GCM10011385_09410 [Nitratireductor aestuarii]|jgi:hypothetical protein|uniref:Uncharacterized protein n=1 Tax=Nitratireductor aestuarii TaxID=1735103 RepID=A0A916RIR5_9HYPH|nr:hypothetical protein [Nitratireductor aestuarii]GGA58002.1 hypothetical protein GCM10011385_09410 [Nitratireductor aestuarii]